MVHFYFDFISPYAYFAWLRMRGICQARGVELVLHPIVFGAVLSHHGQLGPAEIPSKRIFTFKDISRYAALHGIALRGVAAHPFNPLTALRVSLPAVAGVHQERVIDTLFRGGWGAGADLGDPVAIASLLDAASLPGTELVSRTRDPAIKAALADETARAIAAGVFGVPTMIVGDELVWGNDRLSDLERILDGEDPLPSDLVDRLLSLPSGQQRRR